MANERLDWSRVESDLLYRCINEKWFPFIIFHVEQASFDEIVSSWTSFAWIN